MHNITTNVYYNINTATRYGTGSDFVTAITIKNSCADRRSFEGFARGHAIWPNGVGSGSGTSFTSPRPYSGTC